MKSSLHSFSHEASPSGSKRPYRALTAILCGLSLAVACGDDDGDGTTANGGSGGAAGAAGSAGSAGAAGAAGSAGSAGSGGAAGAAGAGGGGNGPTGTISVLNADATALNFPTTAAVRGTNLWVVNGQLNLLGDGTSDAPFNVVSVPLAGGDVGEAAITLPGNAFFPEGIAAAADGTLYVGSITQGSIVRIPADSTTPDAEELVEPGVAQRGVIGLVVDDDRDRLWFCDSSPLEPGGDLVGVDLETGEEEVRHAMPDPGAGGDAADAGADAGEADAGAAAPATFCNDVIVAPDGDLFATDSSGRIFRVASADVDDANSASVWLEHSAISPPPGGFGANGLDLVGDTLIIAANGLVAVDSTSNDPASTVRTISLTEGGAAATLCGPDGLQTVPGSDNQIVVVENGACATPRERVVQVTLDLD